MAVTKWLLHLQNIDDVTTITPMTCDVLGPYDSEDDRVQAAADIMTKAMDTTMLPAGYTRMGLTNVVPIDIDDGTPKIVNIDDRVADICIDTEDIGVSNAESYPSDETLEERDSSIEDSNDSAYDNSNRSQTGRTYDLAEE